MTFRRIATTILFLGFLAASLLELVPKWQKAAGKETGAVLYVRSTEPQAKPSHNTKHISLESILKANEGNKDG
ncbi:hypothetical protein [Desulfoluna butyratoxydans]|uniref:Uncharacterized protein n=1 Tax=Desulfoluna butyratoxydans TaxID=231438 RepID=A0A4U8YN04_9BACT|nr:hypothetical protein [Desulfoluna butyratoxydans]VFQ45436.1 hypothetical protein MSL71_30930 [Desulfoluna butyratoxydans]